MNRRTWLLLSTAVALLLLTSPGPAAAARTLTQPDPGEPVTAALVGVLALTAWLLVLWLAGTALLLVGSTRRGPLGTACAGALRRVAPVAVRRAVALALGIGVVLAVGGPAQAAPVRATATSQLDRPAADLSADIPGFDWPTSTTAGAAATTTATAAAAGVPEGTGSVVVRAGDSLWRLAAAHLAAPATDAEVAVAWPLWWSANRAVIGDDPGLLRPGQHLAVPDLLAARAHPTHPGVQP